jgi:hypothetical protein
MSLNRDAIMCTGVGTGSDLLDIDSERDVEAGLWTGLVEARVLPSQDLLGPIGLEFREALHGHAQEEERLGLWGRGEPVRDAVKVSKDQMGRLRLLSACHQWPDECVCVWVIT